MTIGAIDDSQRKAATVVGFSYLFALPPAIFAEFYVRTRLVVFDNAAQTAQNIMAHERLFRLGTASNLTVFALDVVLIIALYVVLMPVNRSLALLATGWGLIMSLAPLLQARIVIRRRDSSGTSIAWMIVLLIGFILWLCYGGAAIGNMPLIVTNIVSCTACTATLAVVLRFRGKKAADGS